MGKPVVNYPLLSSPVAPRGSPLELGVGNFGPQGGMGGEMYGASGDLLRPISAPSEADKPMIIELAVAAMEELIRMAQMGEPLWMTSLDGASALLNEDEYVRTFPRGIGPKPAGFKCEASRETAVVIMNHINLVEILMDVVISGSDYPNPNIYFFNRYNPTLIFCRSNLCVYKWVAFRINGRLCFLGLSQEQWLWKFSQLVLLEISMEPCKW